MNNTTQKLTEFLTFPPLLSSSELVEIEEIDKRERMQGETTLRRLFGGETIAGERLELSEERANYIYRHAIELLESLESEEGEAVGCHILHYLSKYIANKAELNKLGGLAGYLFNLLKFSIYHGIKALKMENDGDNFTQTDRRAEFLVKFKQYDSRRSFYFSGLERLAFEVSASISKILGVKEITARDIIDNYHNEIEEVSEFWQVIEIGKRITMQIGETLWRSGDESHITEEDKEAWAAYLAELS